MQFRHLSLMSIFGIAAFASFTTTARAEPAESRPTFAFSPFRFHAGFEGAIIYKIPKPVREVSSYNGTPVRLSDPTGGALPVFGYGFGIDVKRRFDIWLDAFYDMTHSGGNRGTWSEAGGFNGSDDYVGYEFSGWHADITGSYRFFKLFYADAGVRYQFFVLKGGVDAYSTFRPQTRTEFPLMQPVFGLSNRFCGSNPDEKYTDYPNCEVALAVSPSVTHAHDQAQMTMVQLMFRTTLFTTTW